MNDDYLDYRDDIRQGLEKEEYSHLAPEDCKQCSYLDFDSRYGCIEPVCIGLDRGICPDDKKDCPLNIELIKL